MLDLGKIMVTPKGPYSAQATYEILDLVEYEGKSYIALKTVTGIAPTDDGENWRIHSASGITSWNDLNDRPFYEITEQAEILPEATYTTTVIDDGAYIDTDFTLEEGKTYTVIINGEERKCVAERYVLPGTDESHGMLLLRYKTDAPTLNIIWYPPSIRQETKHAAFIEHVARTLTVKILGDVPVGIHHIDPKYIKDMYYTEGTADEEIVPETQFVDEDAATGTEELIYYQDDLVFFEYRSYIPIEEGGTYSVVYNGTSYLCTAERIEEDGSSLFLLGDLYTFSGGAYGTGPTGEPFVMLIAETQETASLSGRGMQGIILDGSTPVTLAISGGGTTIHKIPNKYLDLKWLPTINTVNDLLYEETRQYPSGGHFMLEKLLFEIKTGGKYTVTIDEDTYQATGRSFAVQGIIINYIGNLARTYELGGMVEDTGEPFCIYIITASGYTMTHFYVDIDDARDVYISVVGPKDILNRLPYEFLPPEVGETYDISDVTFETTSMAQRAKEKNQRVTFNGTDVLYAKYSDVFGCKVIYVNNLGIRMTNGSPSMDSYALFASMSDLKTGQLLSVSGLSGGIGIKGVDPYVLTSPNGTKYKITVDDSGKLNTTPV